MLVVRLWPNLFILAFGLVAALSYANPQKVIIIDSGFNINDKYLRPYLDPESVDLHSEAQTHYRARLNFLRLWAFRPGYTTKSLNERVATHGTNVAQEIVMNRNAEKLKTILIDAFPPRKRYSWPGDLTLTPDNFEKAIEDLLKQLQKQLHNCDVFAVNMSVIPNFSGHPHQATLEGKLQKELHRLMRQCPQTLFVFSAGNKACDMKDPQSTSPLRFLGHTPEPNAIFVGSHNAFGQRSAFSNFGKEVDTYQFGEGVSYCLPKKYPWNSDRYLTEAGTSFAAPRLINRALDISQGSKKPLSGMAAYKALLIEQKKMEAMRMPANSFIIDFSHANRLK